MNQIKLVIVVVVLLAAGIAGYLAIGKDRKNEVPVPNNETSSNSSARSNIEDISSTQKKYSNDKFSLIYPNTWKVEESAQPNVSGRVLTLVSPETQKSLNDGTNSSGYDVNVSFWPNVNDEYARGGSWQGQRTYTSLVDFLTDKESFKHKIGDIMIDGKVAHEVIIGGMGTNYAVMIENDGVYEFSFETAWDKTMLSDTQKQILESFKFSQ